MKVQIILLSVILGFSLSSCSKKDETPAQVSAQPVENPQVKLNKDLVAAVQNDAALKSKEHLAKVTEALEKGGDPNATNALGEPVLADAIHFGDGKSDNLEVAAILIEKGADVNAIGSTGRSPVTKAAESNNLEAMKLLVEKGADLDTKNGTKALIKAAFNDHRGMVRFLMSNGVKPNGIYGETLFDSSLEESYATAAVVGSYVDLLHSELKPLLNPAIQRRGMQNVTLQLGSIQKHCEKMNTYEFTPLQDNGFQERSECTSMGTLGSTAYKHCYGLMNSQSAALEGLNTVVTMALLEARAALKIEQVSFEQVKDRAELEGYDDTLLRAKNLYQDFALPTARATYGKLGHHSKRNQQLQRISKSCGRKDILASAKSIAGSIFSVRDTVVRQEASAEAEIEKIDEMRSMIRYQLPALDSANTLERKAEEKRLKELEEKEKQKEKDSSEVEA